LKPPTAGSRYCSPAARQGVREASCLLSNSFIPSCPQANPGQQGEGEWEEQRRKENRELGRKEFFISLA